MLGPGQGLGLGPLGLGRGLGGATFGPRGILRDGGSPHAQGALPTPTRQLPELTEPTAGLAVCVERVDHSHVLHLRSPHVACNAGSEPAQSRIPPPLAGGVILKVESRV